MNMSEAEIRQRAGRIVAARNEGRTQCERDFQLGRTPHPDRYAEAYRTLSLPDDLPSDTKDMLEATFLAGYLVRLRELREERDRQQYDQRH